jgi:hypothetical protein
MAPRGKRGSYAGQEGGSKGPFALTSATQLLKQKRGKENHRKKGSDNKRSDGKGVEPPAAPEQSAVKTMGKRRAKRTIKAFDGVPLIARGTQLAKFETETAAKIIIGEGPEVKFPRTRYAYFSLFAKRL